MIFPETKKKFCEPEAVRTSQGNESSSPAWFSGHFQEICVSVFIQQSHVSVKSYHKAIEGLVTCSAPTLVGVNANRMYNLTLQGSRA